VPTANLQPGFKIYSVIIGGSKKPVFYRLAILRQPNYWYLQGAIIEKKRFSQIYEYASKSSPPLAGMNLI
jgi:hypothetical protein